MNRSAAALLFVFHSEDKCTKKGRGVSQHHDPESNHNQSFD